MEKSLRERCMAYVRRRCAAGASRAEVARELGLSEMTVHRWARDAKPTTAIVPVRVIDVADTRGVVVKTPRGLQIEGLDFDTLCALISRMG